MMLEPQFTPEPLLTLVAWKGNAGMFSHVVAIVSRDRKASLTVITPEFELALMVLHVAGVT